MPHAIRRVDVAGRCANHLLEVTQGVEMIPEMLRITCNFSYERPVTTYIQRLKERLSELSRRNAVTLP